MRPRLATSKQPAGGSTGQYSPVYIVNRVSKPYKPPPPAPAYFLCRLNAAMWYCSPIIVEKASSDVTDDQAQALCDEVQAAVLKLYEDHKPAWETRPVVFER